MASNEAQFSSHEVAQSHGIINSDTYETNRHKGSGVVTVNAQDGSYLQNSGIRPRDLKGYRHIFDPWTKIKWEHPRFYREPGLGYQKLSHHRHKDVFEREWTGDYDDRYLSAWDGRISKLVVQTVDDIYDNNTTATYRRTFIRNIAPLYLRLANWPFNHVNYHLNDGRPTSEGTYVLQNYPMLCLKWFIASLAITFVISSPSSAEVSSRNNGRYDPVPYRYHGYPKVARNELELSTPGCRSQKETNPVAERVLRPRYLCVLREQGVPAMIVKVEDNSAPLSYVFIAYTVEQFRSNEDKIALHKMADAAARNAGVSAYWVGCSCMPDDQLQEDVYRICDVIRGAFSLVIAVGRPPNDMYDISTVDRMLQQWGSRVWTFPEVLLAPAGKDVEVYLRENDLGTPLRVPKNQFADRVWRDDAHVARQLIEHYEGNMILSQLELVTLALECLHKRHTTQYLPGDHSYALMGLLRIRPKIDPTDSALSLANGSDQLLERLICVLPRTPDQPWHSMDDAYKAKLWDILPQDVGIAGVGEDDSIILDGCRAANVRWKSFTPVAHTRRASFKRWLAKKMLRLGGVVFAAAIVLASISTTRLIGVILIIYSLLLMGLSPWLLRMLYLGKFWEQQCWFFGFEGYMDIDTIERQLFGGRLGRMKWTPYASPLSRHHRNEHAECIPDDPTSDPAIAALVQQAKCAGPGQQRIFTLVDTGNMTATLFLAERPPVCFLMAGSEGGMKRIIGCSYDWTTGTMYRETVLRMETQFEDSMCRVGRVKIGFRRSQHPSSPLAEVGEAKGQQMS
ncbi:hypothetical protein P153DRAFT_397288 [Dothidotthia symphoricarpi CBS 119687]|uniref:Heterokaryon incompatibility domain-containing protein n=1 Tax=Dothidotthia symphoricarpi CBS 119687 TaxID=1392245 RepID=A0A6A6AFA9_9PLEO|nr:uncharacterized protein P153DRAFT_397288 [Dothidotthia symphoricarpi CBS 119687]KAF2129101.1 hypothetical protein P153DRAFT_397288 [Dothidotthia symphoricarpi CBS 119687]